jgi:hypothetical protein
VRQQPTDLEFLKQLAQECAPHGWISTPRGSVRFEDFWNSAVEDVTIDAMDEQHRAIVDGVTALPKPFKRQAVLDLLEELR